MKAGSNWKRFRRRLRYLLDRRNRNRLFWEEMEFHINSLVQELTAQGIPEEEARTAARRRFGNMTHQSEAAHSIWIANWITDLIQDIRYSFRGMRRNAGFTAFTIIIAGFGIGATSTVFTLVNALLMRPLPFRDPGRLVWVANGKEGHAIQAENYSDLRALNHSFSDLAGWNAYFQTGNEELTGSGDPERLTAVAVTGTFFPLLGVQPAIGRSFTAEECEGKYSAPRAAVLSYSFWSRRFLSDLSVVGRKLILNNQPVTVVGVLPASFDFASVFVPDTPLDVFIPWPLNDQTKPRGNTMKVIGRLKPGVTIQSAQADFNILAKRLQKEHPERNPVAPGLEYLEQHVSKPVSRALFVLACAVAVVMLIVCANLSNLQLARLSARQTEMTMRAALGAGRSRLVRQLIAESVALGCSGAVLGLILAVAGARELAHLDVLNFPLLSTVRVDGTALGFTLLAAVATGILFGVLPALQVSAISLGNGLQDAGKRSRGGRRSSWIRDGLVISEIAFACILLVGAGLLLRSFIHVLDTNLGFEPERATVLRIDPSFKLSSFAEENTFIDNVLRSVRAVPGIAAAGITDALPLRDDRSWSVAGRGQIYPKGHQPEAFVRVVTDGYFAGAGVPLKSGRVFTERDRATSEPVVIVNQTMARTLWPGQNPIGQMITTDGGRRVIGVVADVRHTAVEQASGLEMYLPMRQTGDFADMELVVRTALPPDSLAAGIRTALRPIDPNLPVRDFVPLRDLVDRAISPRRILVILLTGFAVFALALASLGIYAVISYSVSQRVPEIGIRMAIGASAGDVQRGIILRTLVLALFGLALGLAGSGLTSKGMESLLYGVTASDSATFAGITVLLLAVATLAGYIPAWKASRMDPMSALRSE